MSPLLLEELTGIASRAAAAIRAVDASHAEWRIKADRSPVTAADEAAQEVILADLSSLLPGVPVVAEEDADERSVRPGADLVLVDPLDGTREFLAGRDEFTVNIGIIIDHAPAMGVIAAPALSRIWRGIVGRGAERLRLSPGARPSQASDLISIRARKPPADGIVAMVSRSHLDERTVAFLASLPACRQIALGSSLKFCRIAEGRADLYPRLAPTSEWDIAAGHAILAAAGGVVTTPIGNPLTYASSPDGFTVPGFLAWGDPAAARSISYDRSSSPI
ncbi:3'(2'),5'-bisphosphate nucleotidase CysQ family protein [Inquilinus sp. OTU3971]|uniref:3'(2'),5'-bisphosphate nucleotidase CysQ family protein n=1 Tax=Inquilinus sp. OTU3971 TaxID=3043855 RepID=UPI00313BB379